MKINMLAFLAAFGLLFAACNQQKTNDEIYRDVEQARMADQNARATSTKADEIARADKAYKDAREALDQAKAKAQAEQPLVYRPNIRTGEAAGGGGGKRDLTGMTTELAETLAKNPPIRATEDAAAQQTATPTPVPSDSSIGAPLSNDPSISQEAIHNNLFGSPK
jgi:hypothetical protein